jgi:hypothetical protein
MADPVPNPATPQPVQPVPVVDVVPIQPVPGVPQPPQPQLPLGWKLPDVPQSWFTFSRQTLNDILTVLGVISGIVASITALSAKWSADDSKKQGVENYKAVEELHDKTDAVKAKLDVKEAEEKGKAEASSGAERSSDGPPKIK